MFNTILEGVEKYKAELLEYVAWRSECEKYYSERGYGPCLHTISAWLNNDRLRLLSWLETLDGMKKALGLTEEEVAQLDKEFGVKRAPETP